MSVAPTLTLVVQDGDETTPVVPIPVRLVTENGEPFQPGGSAAPATIVVSDDGPLSGDGTEDNPLTLWTNGSTTFDGNAGSYTDAAQAIVVKFKDGSKTLCVEKARTTHPGVVKQAAAVEDASESVTVEKFNELLANLRAAGILGQ